MFSFIPKCSLESSKSRRKRKQHLMILEQCLSRFFGTCGPPLPLSSLLPNKGKTRNADLQAHGPSLGHSVGSVGDASAPRATAKGSGNSCAAARGSAQRTRCEHSQGLLLISLFSYFKC